MNDRQLTGQQTTKIGLVSGVCSTLVLSVLYSIWSEGARSTFGNSGELCGMAAYAVLSIPGGIAGAKITYRLGGTRLLTWVGAALVPQQVKDVG